MTKEEIRNKADEFSIKVREVGINGGTKYRSQYIMGRRIGFVAGAECRQPEIDELMAENDKLKKRLEKQYAGYKFKKE